MKLAQVVFTLKQGFAVVQTALIFQSDHDSMTNEQTPL